MLGEKIECFLSDRKEVGIEEEDLGVGVVEEDGDHGGIVASV